MCIGCFAASIVATTVSLRWSFVLHAALLPVVFDAFVCRWPLRWYVVVVRHVRLVVQAVRWVFCGSLLWLEGTVLVVQWFVL